MEEEMTQQEDQGAEITKNQPSQPPPPPQKCPRCDSTNTKFCYYNNYCLTQPRYFCKTCRRYWTQGGTQRNVPVGGGSRKGKRNKPASTTGETSEPQSLSSLAKSITAEANSSMPTTHLAANASASATAAAPALAMMLPAPPYFPGGGFSSVDSPQLFDHPVNYCGYNMDLLQGSNASNSYGSQQQLLYPSDGNLVGSTRSITEWTQNFIDDAGVSTIPVENRSFWNINNSGSSSSNQDQWPDFSGYGPTQ